MSMQVAKAGGLFGEIASVLSDPERIAKRRKELRPVLSGGIVERVTTRRMLRELAEHALLGIEVLDGADPTKTHEWRPRFVTLPMLSTAVEMKVGPVRDGFRAELIFPNGHRAVAEKRRERGRGSALLAALEVLTGDLCWPMVKDWIAPESWTSNRPRHLPWLGIPEDLDQLPEDATVHTVYTGGATTCRITVPGGRGPELIGNATGYSRFDAIHRAVSRVLAADQEVSL